MVFFISPAGGGYGFGFFGAVLGVASFTFTQALRVCEYLDLDYIILPRFFVHR